VEALTTPSAYPSALSPTSLSGVRAPLWAICCRSGLSSISTSGSVLDDACWSTFWISEAPGTVSRWMVAPAC
jgi:hypothetical protein